MAATTSACIPRARASHMTTHSCRETRECHSAVHAGGKGAGRAAGGRSPPELPPQAARSPRPFLTAPPASPKGPLSPVQPPGVARPSASPADVRCSPSRLEARPRGAVTMN